MKSKMNIYLVESGNNNYDAYDSFVCVAESEENARNIHPDCDDFDNEKRNSKEWEVEQDLSYKVWVASPKDVKVTLIGKSDPSIKKEKFICKSFNAG